MKRLSILLLTMWCLLTPGLIHAGAIGDAGGFSGGAGGGGGGGGGTLITSGAGAFGSSTSQTGGVLTGALASNVTAPTNAPGAFVSIGNSGNGLSSSVASAPASIVNGNPLILAIALAGGSGTPTFTFPSGFAQIGSTVCNTAGAKQCVAVACKIASSESGNYTTTWSGGNGSSSYSSVVQGSGFNCTSDTSQSAHANSNTITVPALSPTGNNDFLFAIAANAVNGSNVVTQLNTSLLTPQAGPGGLAGVISIYTGSWGSGTTPSFGFVATGSADFAGIVVAFTPTATATNNVAVNNAPANHSALYVSGAATVGGIMQASQFLVPTDSSNPAVSGFFFGASAGKGPFRINYSTSGSLNFDQEHNANFISMGGGAWTSLDTLLLNGGGEKIVSHDASQDLSLITQDTSNNFYFGCASGTGSCSSGSSENADNYFGTNNAHTFHFCFDNAGQTSCTDSETLTATAFNILTGATLQSAGGAIPTATCSGGSTGVSIATGSTNNRGQIVTSSSASTNCTITWSAAGVWNQAPFCVASDGSGSTTPAAVAVGTTGTSTMVLDFASATSKTFNWVCL